MLANQLNNVNDEVKSNVGKLSTIQRNIRRQRQKLNPTGQLNVDDLEFSDEFKSTEGKYSQDFIYDSGRGIDRIIVFSYKKRLETLGSAERWYMDGTYKLSTSSIQPLFVVHAARKTSLCMRVCVRDTKYQGYARNLVFNY